MARLASILPSGQQGRPPAIVSGGGAGQGGNLPIGSAIGSSVTLLFLSSDGG
jgi:hypothetical protein